MLGAGSYGRFVSRGVTSLELLAHRSRLGALQTVPSTAFNSLAEAGRLSFGYYSAFPGAKHKLPSCGLLESSAGLASPEFFLAWLFGWFSGHQVLGGFTH